MLRPVSRVASTAWWPSPSVCVTSTLGLLARLLDHVGQVVPVVFGQGSPQDHQVKGILAQGFLHLLAAFRLGYLVSRFLDRNRLCGKDFRVAFSIKNLQFG